MLTVRYPRALLAALSLVLPLGACGDDSGPSPSERPAAMLLDGAVTPPEYEDEISALFHAVTDLGFPLDTTSQQDSTSIAALIAGKSILFLPEVETSFDAGTQAILAEFVEAGGTIVAVGGYEHTEWLNTAFGWALVDTGGFDLRIPMPKLAEASGTPFSDGPGNILSNDGGGYLSIASLPTDGRAVYGAESGIVAASVAVLPEGEGQVVWFGWDWYDGVPIGLQDGGWRRLLRATADF
jgi:hypothetical protein